jgi:hypothetical protein
MAAKKASYTPLSNQEYVRLENMVYGYNTKYKEGFLPEEQQELLENFPSINLEEYYETLGVNTCIMKEGKFVTYHCDVLTAIVCSLERRDKRLEEWD